MEKVDSFRKHTPDLWTLDGDWQESAMRRRMTVMRTAEGSLVVHNAMKVPDQYLAELAGMGRVAAIVIPNFFHDSEAPWFASRFPGVPVFAPSRLVPKTKKRCSGVPVESIESFSRQVFAASVRGIPVPGQRWLDEAWFYHPASESLVVCDLAFNMREHQFHGIERVLMRWNRVGCGFGPSRLATSVFIRDHSAFASAVQVVAGLKLSRIIVNHGAVIEDGAMEAFRAAFAGFLPP